MAWHAGAGERHPARPHRGGYQAGPGHLAHHRPGPPRPAWHIWQPATGPDSAGAAYLLTGPGEQPLPGLAGGGQATVTVPAARSGGPAVTWTADVTRVLPGSAEWDAVIGPLVAGRLNAVLTGEETSPAPRWARSGAIYRLTPVDRRPR